MKIPLVLFSLTHCTWAEQALEDAIRFWLYRVLLWMAIRPGLLEDLSEALSTCSFFAFALVSFIYKYHCFPGHLSSNLEQISRIGSGAFFKLNQMGIQ